MWVSVIFSMAVVKWEWEDDKRGIDEGNNGVSNVNGFIFTHFRNFVFRACSVPVEILRAGLGFCADFSKWHCQD